MRQNLKFKQLSLLFLLAVLFTLSVNAISLLMLRQAYDSVIAAQEQRQRAMSLVNELQQETEQLAGFVTAYTGTGQTRYLTYYHDILAIRQGEKPQPENYVPGSYWDMAIADEIQHQFPQDGEQRSLSERMKSLGFSEEEFNAFGKVSAATEAMKQIERIAFAAAQGLYDPLTGESVSGGKPRLDFANQLVHSQKYNQLKSDLAKSLVELVSRVDTRTLTAASRAAKGLERWIFLTFGSVVFTFVTVLAALSVFRRRVLQPIETLAEAAGRLRQGDYSTRTGVSGGGVEELVALGAAFDSMAETIEQSAQLRQQVQQELEAANRKAEGAARAKAMFLANMSHEIRTPMNAIIGMAYLALKTELTPRQRDYIEKAHNAAKSLLEIINDILDFSKAEADKLELEHAPFILEDVVGNAVSMLSLSAHEKEVEMLLDITDPLLLGESGSLLGDGQRLGQVLTNLLSNAVKFTHQGYIKLTITIEQRSDDDVLLRFSLRDTGIGLSAEQEEGELFLAFTQADGSTTRKYGGTGLGLAISKKLVELMGGRIWVESMPDEGSNFIFTARFPMAEPMSPVAAALPGVDVLRVLVVDDLLEARRVLVDLLAAFGVGAAYGQAIDSSASGEAALAMVRQAFDAGQPYDVLMQDWVMPDMDGGGLLQALQNSGMPHLPLSVVVSAYDSETMREAAVRLGVQHFLPKPVLPQALRKLLNTLTDNAINERGGSYDDRINADFNGMRVLLVEDNPINQQLAIELMEGRGIEVTVANNGQEALDQLAAVAPDHYHVVLMDLQMPVMDGYEATRRLRTDSRYSSLPLVAMTAHARVDERDRCEALGMNGHLGKPIEPDEFYATLARYYTGSAAALADIRQDAESADDSVQQLPNIAGLDALSGLRYAGNMPKLYRQMLDMFAGDFADSSDTLAGYLANAQWEEVERLAHTLKGLAGTIGANEVQISAAKLEAASKGQQAEIAAAALDALTTLLTPLLAALQQYLTEGQSAEESAVAEFTQTVQPGKLPDCLPQLLQLLAEGDSDAVDLWENHHKEFACALLPQVAQRIGTALQNFDFDTAQALLAELPVQLPNTTSTE
ncbi:MAG: response regulator [Methylobacter sp.]|nr:response regulator [Methylobacter sp.]